MWDSSDGPYLLELELITSVLRHRLQELYTVSSLFKTVDDVIFVFVRCIYSEYDSA